LVLGHFSPISWPISWRYGAVAAWIGGETGKLPDPKLIVRR
jgi:hypothetical protein